MPKKTKSKKRTTGIEESSGNVFADLGLPDPEQELLKARLALNIHRIIKERDLTQAQAGAILGIKQPHVSALMRNRAGNLSVGRLFEFLAALDHMRRFLAAAIIVLATGLSHGARAEVLIGVAGPMTGNLAWSGEQMQRGAEMAVADINAAGGVLGQSVRLVAADDFCDSAQVVAAARKLVAEGVVFVAGHYCSGASIPASAVYEEAGILQISPASSNPLLTEQGRANVFRVYSRDDADGVVAGDYLADHWSDRKIAILHDDTTFGKGLADLTKAQLNKRGLTEAIYRAYVPGKEDYSAEIAALQAADVAALFVGGYHTEVALMARAIRDRGYPVQIVTGSDLATENFYLIAGPAAEGILFTFLGDARKNAAAAPVIDRFRAENFEPEGYTLYTYGAVQVWAQAIEKAGSAELQAIIASLRKNQFDTVLGRLDFDDKGDVIRLKPIWHVWKGGKYVPLE